MPGRRRTGFWVAGVLGLAVVGALAVGVAQWGHRTKATRSSVAFDENTPLSALPRALREGDARALALLQQRLTIKTDTPPSAIGEEEAESWMKTLEGLRTGFLRFGGYGRSSALALVGKVLQRLAVDPAPSIWSAALHPAHDLFTAGLADPDLEVRVSALTEIGRVWGWIPGRTPAAREEQELAAWKEGLVAPVVRRLGDREPKSRLAAIRCLGQLPIAASAAPAIAYLEDKESAPVRQQVLISFAQRPSLLSEDVIAKHLYDSDPAVCETAETVLKLRGLEQEQISLARMINHPKPGMRVSVIPLLKNRADIDPVVWLLQLSQDSEESVRTAAVEALESQDTPEARSRLIEMSRTDKSPSVRAVACKLLGIDPGATVALPPLPGSQSLSPKAN